MKYPINSLTRDLFPNQGEPLLYIGKSATLTPGSYYKVREFDYSIIMDYQISVINDKGFEEWANLTEFSLLDE